MTEHPSPSQEHHREKPFILSKSDLLGVIDAEVELILKKQTWHGYTTWALIGAFAALSWLLLSILEHGNYSGARAMRVLLCLQLLYVSFSLLRHSFFSTNPSNTSLRFRYVDVYELRASLVAFLYCATCTFILVKYFDNAGQIPKLFLMGLFGFLGLVLPATVLLSLFRVPVSSVVTAPKWLGKLAFTVTVVGILLALQSLIESIDIGAITFDDFRIALLLSVLGELGGRLTRVSKDFPTLQSLILIRREFALEKIDIRAAINQTEVALAGMRVNDVLQEDIRAYLEPVGKMLAVYHDAITRMDALHAELPPEPECLTKEGATVARTVLELCKDKIQTTKGDLDIIRQRARKVHKRMKWFHNASNERDVVYQAMERALTDLEQKIDEFTSKAMRLRNRLEGSKGQLITAPI